MTRKTFLVVTLVWLMIEFPALGQDGCGCAASVHAGGAAFGPVAAFRSGSGACVSCKDLWANYCEEKSSCIDPAPFQNRYHNTCAVGCAGMQGVGPYRRCNCGGHAGKNWLSFLHRNPTCSSCEAIDLRHDSCHAPQPTSQGSENTIPLIDGGKPEDARYNVFEPDHSAPSAEMPADSPVIEQNWSTGDGPRFDSPTPEVRRVISDSIPEPESLPSVSDQTRNVNGFNWLQRALQLD